MRTLVGFQRDRAQIGQIGSPSGGEGGDGTPPQLDLRAHVRRRAPRRPAQSLVGWGYAHGAMPGGAGGGGGKRRPAATLWSLLSQEGSPLRTQTLSLQRSTLPPYTEADAASHAASHAAARASGRDRDRDHEYGASISLASPPPPPRGLPTPPPSPPNGPARTRLDPAAAARDGSRDASRRSSAAEQRVSGVAAGLNAQGQSLREEAAESLRELQARSLVITPCRGGRRDRSLVITPCRGGRRARSLVITPCRGGRRDRSLVITPCRRGCGAPQAEGFTTQLPSYPPTTCPPPTTHPPTHCPLPADYRTTHRYPRVPQSVRGGASHNHIKARGSMKFSKVDQ